MRVGLDLPSATNDDRGTSMFYRMTVNATTETLNVGTLDRDVVMVWDVLEVAQDVRDAFEGWGYSGTLEAVSETGQRKWMTTFGVRD